MRLSNLTKKSDIASHVTVADDFISRNKGLLGRKEFPEGQALWILRCPSIHTFFMAFAIDAIFVDRQLKVRAVYKNLVPWRMTKIVLRASSVIELPAGTLNKSPTDVGDSLYVGD
jgi:uncharacterized membrane protein (UPF0127 family)